MGNHTEYEISGPAGLVGHGIVEEGGKLPIPDIGEHFIKTRRLNDDQARSFRKRHKGNEAKPLPEGAEDTELAKGELPRWGHDRPGRGRPIRGNGDGGHSEGEPNYARGPLTSQGKPEEIKGNSENDPKAGSAGEDKKHETDTSADAKEQARLQDERERRLNDPGQARTRSGGHI